MVQFYVFYAVYGTDGHKRHIVLISYNVEVLVLPGTCHILITHLLCSLDDYIFSLATTCSVVSVAVHLIYIRPPVSPVP